MALIESVPNISEGRRPDVIAALEGAVRRPGVHVLDVSADVSHNRSVLTIAGEAAPLGEAILALFEVALDAIDLRTHSGVHPRVGAVDVVPFVPLEGATMDQCVALARHTAAEVARRFNLPVYLYEDAAAQPGRRRLEDIRRGQFEGLGAKMARPGWQPDFGPATPHPAAGASVIGARMPLIAYNVNLATDRLEVARRIAATIRESGGGLPCVKAMGVALADRGIVQVSMNLTNYQITGMVQVFEVVSQRAADEGVAVLDSELIGLVPAAALPADAGQVLRLQSLGTNQTIETRLRGR